jgi:hypothetical protein
VHVPGLFGHTTEDLVRSTSHTGQGADAQVLGQLLIEKWRQRVVSEVTKRPAGRLSLAAVIANKLVMLAVNTRLPIQDNSGD